jgi:hypothetical protein
METLPTSSEELLVEYDRLHAPPRRIKVGDRVKVTLADEETLDFNYAGVGDRLSGHTGIVIGITPGTMGGKFPPYYRVLMLDCLVPRWRRSIVFENVLHLTKSELEFVEDTDPRFFTKNKTRLLRLLPILPTYRYRDRPKKKDKRYVGLHRPDGFVIYRSLVMGIENKIVVIDLGRPIYYCRFEGPDPTWVTKVSQTGKRVKVHWTRLLEPSNGLLGTVRFCREEVLKKTGTLPPQGELID